MQEKIAVFDENGIEAGRTYHRRAKQLVAKGRAAWHNSDKTAIHMMPEENESDKEIIIMEYDTAENKPDNEEMLYAAKRNVRLKRSLKWHIIAFVIAAPLIYILFVGFLDNVLHQGRFVMNDGRTLMSEMNNMAFHFTAAGDTEAAAILAQAARDLVNSPNAVTYGTSHWHAAWFFTWGAYAAWGIFIATRLVMYFVPKIKQREEIQVSAEYRRLAKSDTVDLRKNA